MQPLTLPPRDTLTEDQVRAILNADSLIVGAGIELLDDNHQVEQDLTDDLRDGRIERHNYADVHGTCALELARPLAWGRSRVRPYMTLSDGAITARFNLGVYLVTTPETPIGETPPTYSVMGYDLLHILQDGPGDTWTACGDGALLTRNKTVTYNGSMCNESGFGDNYAIITDGTTTTSPYFSTYAGTGYGPNWVKVDIGHVEYVDHVTIWHYYGDNRTFHETKTEISVDGTNWTTIFDSSVEGEYAENTNGYGHDIPIWRQKVRYIRDWANGSTASARNHWVEVACYDEEMTYLYAIERAVNDSGIGVPLLLDGTRQGLYLSDTEPGEDLVWALTDKGPTWLEIINDLLAAINYRGIYLDQDGNLRSGPYAAPQTRAIEWTFDTDDPKTSLIAEDRVVRQDTWGAVNHWRFVRSNITAQPSEGSGIYTVTNQSSGPTSIDALGRTVHKVVFLDAADQATLALQGDQIVAEDRQFTRTFEVDVDPLPIAGHFDVVHLVEDGVPIRCQVQSWELNLDGSPGRWVLEAINGV